MLKIIYEDNHLIVCFKPKGILSQADGSNKKDMLTLLKAYLKEKYQKPGDVYLGLVHRLDINTSGVMVFAKTSKAAKRLSVQIANHQFEKYYRALVEGKVNESDRIVTKIKKDVKNKKAIYAEDGDEAILTYNLVDTVYKNNKLCSIVDIRLLTGRFHQIRFQFSQIGHPLYGDNKYGSLEKIAYDEFPLEAYHLGFYHPITKDWLVFECKKSHF